MKRIIFYVACIISFLCIPVVTRAAVSTDNLVGYWKFDESVASSTVIDYSGHGMNGIPAGAGGPPQPTSTVASGFVFSNARALDLNGADDYINVANAGLPTTDFTYSGWIYLQDNLDETVFEISDGSGGNEFQFYIDSDQTLGIGTYIVAIDNDFTAVSGATVITEDVWHHIAIRRSSTTISVYIDGTLDDTGTDGTVLNFSTCPLLIGVDMDSGCVGSLGNWMDGIIDDVRIYSRALSSSEITELAAKTHPSATWDGSSSTSTETAANWDTSAVPDPYTRWIIPDVSNDPVAATATSLAGLTLNASSTFDLLGFNLTFNDSGTFSNAGTLRLFGSQTLSGFSNDTDSGMLTYSGTTSVNGLPAGNTYYDVAFNDGLVGYWKLDESLASTTVADYSVYGNHGTPQGATGGNDLPQPTSTVASGFDFTNTSSFDFDGTDDGVRIDSVLGLGDRLLTIAAWVYLASTSEGGAFVKIGQHSGSDAGYGIGVGNSTFDNNGNDLILLFEGIRWIDTGDLIGTGWHHIAMTINASGVPEWFIDGTSGGTSAGTVARSPAGGETKIGGYTSSILTERFVDTVIDDVRVYKRVLSTAELGELVAGTHPTGVTYTLDAALDVNRDLHLRGGTLDVSESDYGVSVGRGWYGYGSLFIPHSGTTTFDGSSAATIFTDGHTFNNLTFNGSGTWSLESVLDIDSAFSLLAGTLETGGFTMTVGGNWTNTDTFTHENNTVTFDGTNQTLSGTTTFYNFTKTESADNATDETLTFPAGATTTIEGTWTLDGRNDDDRINLVSSSPGTPWHVDTDATTTLDYISVTDSRSASVITCTDNCENGGGNTNWLFSTPSVSFTVGTSTLVENGATTTLTLALSGAADLEVTLPFSVSGTAASGTDYTLTASPATISAGGTSTTLTLAPQNDGFIESNETIVVVLGTPTNATLGATATHTVTLVSEDAPAVSFGDTTSTIDETDGPLSVILELSEAATATVQVSFSVSGTATESSDYTISSSPISLTAGTTTGAVVVTLLNDGDIEEDETIIISMTGATNASTTSPTTHTITLTSEDVPDVSFALDTSTVAETAGSHALTVELSEAATDTVSVSFEVSGTAASGTDFTIEASPITIGAGSTTAALDLMLLNDSDVESNETIIVTISDVTGAATTTPDEHTVTLTSEDAAPDDEEDEEEEDDNNGDNDQVSGSSRRRSLQTEIDAPSPIYVVITEFLTPDPFPAPLPDEPVEPTIIPIPDDVPEDEVIPDVPEVPPVVPSETSIIDTALLGIRDAGDRMLNAFHDTTETIQTVLVNIGTFAFAFTDGVLDLTDTMARAVVAMITDGATTFADALGAIRDTARDFATRVENAARDIRTREPKPDPRIPKELIGHRYDEVTIRLAAADGSPLSGAHVTLFSDPQEAVTDTTGSASFYDVPIGEHKLKIAFGAFRGTQELFLKDGAPKVFVGVTPTLTHGVTVSMYITTTLLAFILGGGLVYLFVVYRRRRVLLP